MGQAGEGAEVVDGYELARAFADELPDLAMDAASGFVGVAHEALDLFRGDYDYVFLHGSDRALTVLQ